MTLEIRLYVYGGSTEISGFGASLTKEAQDVARKQERENPFDFENAVVGQPGPDGSPIIRKLNTNGIPGVETRTADGHRLLTFPLSALLRKPLVRITPPPPKKEPRRRPARVAQMLALAHDVEGKLDRGEYEDQAEAARAFGFSRSKLTQLLDLTLLGPDIQEEILFLEAVDGKEPVTERALREVVRNLIWTEQRRAWKAIKHRSARRQRSC